MTRTFCVFEGGGAKGVAHVGVLNAIEKMDEDYNVEGYAGTSAGAIVAALAAAGWKSDELITKDSSGAIISPALAEIGEDKISSLAELFGKEWGRIHRARAIVRGIANGTRWSRFATRFVILISGVVLLWPLFHIAEKFGFIWGSQFPWFQTLLPWLNYVFGVLYGALIAIIFVFLFVMYSRFQGIANLDPPALVIDRLLSHKIKPSNGTQVTFGDIKKYAKVDLKIVASNIDTGAMEMFDHVDYADLPVSKAVAASAAIPLVFKPVDIKGSEYCDGGLVSNLPAWTFDSERLLDEDCLVVTCELSAFTKIDSTPTVLRAPPKRGVKLMESVLKTTIFGASDLNTRGLQHHIKLPLQTDINLLDFERTADQLETIEHCSTIASDRLANHWLERQSLSEIHEEFADYLGIDPKSGHLRSALVREIKMVNKSNAAYQPWHTIGFDGHLDRRIMLPVNGSLVGAAVAQKKTDLLDFRTAGARQRYYTLGLPGLSKALPQDREWFFVAPLNREDKLEGTGQLPDHLSVCLTVDCSLALKGQSKTIMSDFRDIAMNHGIFTPY